MTRLPDFFIIGGPKCGTTSLARWLGEHPAIFLPPLEPHFYDTDHHLRVTPDLATYEWRYRHATAHHRAVGDKSVFYLFSRVAVPNIERERPGAKYVVMVRNPIRMAVSLHGQLLLTGWENVEDFERAWALSGARGRGEEVPARCPEPRLLDYRSVCTLGEQVERLFGSVDRERVHVVVLDDMHADPAAVYAAVLSHLDVPPDARASFPTFNPARKRRSMLAQRAIWAAAKLTGPPKRALRIRRGLGILNRLNEQNAVRQTLTPPSAPMLAEMQATYRDDIALLGDLIDRDLSDWTRT